MAIKHEWRLFYDNFFGNPATFLENNYKVSDTAHDFSLTATDLSKKLWLTLLAKKVPEHHPIYRYWCLLNSDLSFQPRTLTWTNTVRYHSFS